MSRDTMRLGAFALSALIITTVLTVHICQSAYASKVEANAKAVETLRELGGDVAQIDSAKVDALRRLYEAANLAGEKGWLKTDAYKQSYSWDTLTRSANELTQSLTSLSDDMITSKTKRLPALTDACVAAVESAHKPLEALANDIDTLSEKFRRAREQIEWYNKSVCEASLKVHEMMGNDLPMEQIFGCTVASIQTASVTFDQYDNKEAYRRVLIETPMLEWATLHGKTLKLSPQVLGLDIVVRHFVGENNVCQTKVVRFSHGEDILLLPDSRRLIIFYCRPDRFDSRTVVRFLGKQMIVLPEQAK